MIQRRILSMLAVLVVTASGLAGCLGGDDAGDDMDDGMNGGNQTDDNQTDDGGNDTIVVGTDASFPPFEVLNTETGEFEGFDIAVMREIGNRTGREVEFQNLGFDTLIPSLQQGEIDAVISAMSITEERSQQVDFSIPYYEANQSVLMLASEADQYQSLEDLDGAGLTYGAQSGTVGADIVSERFGDAQLRRYDTYPLAVEALKRGDVDAVVMDAPAQEEAAEDDPSIAIAFEFAVGDQYGIAVQQGNEDLLDDINAALTEMFQDGTMDTLAAAYGV